MNFDFPRFPSMGNAERKLYGKQQSAIMKTDVRELEDHYEDVLGEQCKVVELEIRKEEWKR